MSFYHKKIKWLCNIFSMCDEYLRLADHKIFYVIFNYEGNFYMT